MPFQALWSSIPWFRHASYLPALAEPPPLHLQLAFLPLRFLYQHNPLSISLSPHYLKSAFLVISLPQASFCISCCAIPQGLGLLLPPSHDCLHSIDNVVGATALPICLIGLPEGAKSSVSEHLLLKFALTLLLGKMLDVARYSQYGGMLRHLS